jgi:hypothetical protein
MGLRNKFKMSPRLEVEGIQYEIENTRITIARAGGSNAKYNAAMEKVAREHGRAAQLDLLSSAKGIAIVRQVYVDTVILNWETLVDGGWVAGIEGPDGGELLPVTKENMLATFDELPDLFIEVKQMAENLTVFRQSNLEAITKN